MRNFLAALCAIVFAAIAPPVLAEDAVSTFTLDNGMQVVVIEDHRAPVVVHMVWYKTGSADETPGGLGRRAFSRTPDVQGHRHVGAG